MYFAIPGLYMMPSRNHFPSLTNVYCISVANGWYPTELRWWLPVLTLENDTGTSITKIKNVRRMKILHSHLSNYSHSLKSLVTIAELVSTPETPKKGTYNYKTEVRVPTLTLLI